MSSEHVLGTISPVHISSRDIVWEVQRFSHLPQGALFLASSKSFMFHGQEWRLSLRPNLKYYFIPTYLMRKGPSVLDSPNQTWKFRLGLKRRDGVEQIIDTQTIPKEHNYGERWCCSVMSEQLSRSLLKKETDAYVPGGSLIILVRLSVEGLPIVREMRTQTEEHGVEKADQELQEDTKLGSHDEGKVEPVPSLKVLATLSKDLKNFYLSQKDSDTTIKIGNDIFRVHKTILETRVPGITSMLSQNAVEQCDPKAFNIFLQFVYSGDLENMTVDNVVGVYSIAEQFHQLELKDTCVRLMLLNLNVATVFGVLRIAVNCGDSDLQQKATQFLFENAKEVFRLSEWGRFMMDYPTQAQNLIIGSLKYARRSKDSSESS